MSVRLSIHHKIILGAKRWLYSRTGEPYRINGKTLRYAPGSRPVRLRYRNSRNAISRFDALQVETLANGIRPGDTVIDIGAHYGQYSILMAAFAGPSTNIISFEPDPYARKVLKKNVDLNPGLKRPLIEETALSDEVGEAVLYSKGGNSQSSLVRSAVEFNRPESSEAIRVHTIRLDCYLERNRLPAPSWVKIDAEGAEIRILRGAPKLLAGPTRVLLELHPYAWPEFGDTLEDLQKMIAACGRRMVVLGTTEEVGREASYGTVLLDAPRQQEPFPYRP
jgi:FkbM family methyltransferase